MTNWEYKTQRVSRVSAAADGSITRIESMSEAELLKLGDQGWELVTIVNLSIYNIFGPASSQDTQGLEYIFKRPKR